ncbi:hypothetical protein AOQ84DRAFT_354254 [Glonium stellatum]|uniref:RING-type E3 ubiquitin transferase n=1 Tax=Glonium stellatum TaxID=574774 RepID=A0A8E2JTN3_9PEZI|nr:hypothetical protein AOQ84DRAFT_354254 [Glonium stellatum]
MDAAGQSLAEAFSAPDLMNDPAYATNTRKEHDRAFDEADTCRICRGEGTTEEALFYPCKCSGSIKFVHQDCLMQWLSHSQKKYCELCKTPFRFTKLYDPGMPQRLPTTVFFRRAIIHILTHFMTWCRGLLVTSVWLVLLPWCMRVVWRSLFWVGDGGWARDLYADSSGQGPQSMSSQPSNMEIIKSAIDAARTVNSTVYINITIPTFTPIAGALNASGSESTAWNLLKRFFFGISSSNSDYPRGPGMNDTANSTVNDLSYRNPSLLSDINFFKWFNSPAANRFVLDVLEGQIITLLVVIAFILIFLIREWVVQQQPVINMAALDADNAGARAQEERNAGQNGPPDPVENIGMVGDQRLEDLEENADEDEVLDAQDLTGSRTGDADNSSELGPRPAFRHSSSNQTQHHEIRQKLHTSEDLPEEIRRVMQEGNLTLESLFDMIKNLPDEEPIKAKLMKIYDEMDSDAHHSSDEESTVSRKRKRASKEEQRREMNEFEGSNHAESSAANRLDQYPKRSSSLEPIDVTESLSTQHRPNMPTRNRSSIATEIRRGLEEGNSWQFPSPDDSFNGTPDTGRESREVEDSVFERWNSLEDQMNSERNNDRGYIQDVEHDSEHSSESWQQIPDPVVEDGNKAITGDEKTLKGKDKAKIVDESSEQLHRVASAGPSFLATLSSENDSLMVNPTDEPADPSETAAEIESPDLSDSEASVLFPEEDEVQQVEQVIPIEAQPVREARRLHPGLIERITDWLWGDVAPVAPQNAEEADNDEHIVQNMADEAPFVPFGGQARNGPREPANAPAQDPEVAAAAAQAGIDLNEQEAIEDAEDLEGILELIGMQGPITGLFQNAMFSAVLISATLACAVWFPYLWGKVVLLFMGSPVALFIKLPLQFIAALADLIVDACLCISAGAVYWVVQLIRWVVLPLTLGWFSNAVNKPADFVAAPARTIAENAMDRMTKLFVESTTFSSPDYFRLSISSHAALRTIQNTTSEAFNSTGNAIVGWYDSIANSTSGGAPIEVVRQVPAAVHFLSGFVLNKTQEAASVLFKTRPYKITLDLGHNVTSAYASFEQWTATDRLIAIFAGYTFFAVAGALYLKRAAPISSSQQGRKIETIIAEVLQQAGGVLKVILIISIEMIAFPLYCGLLLDIALLPLFENASLYSRYVFTTRSPWTSGFVHWFVGTCYMFHFALFVSMCRKIMRSGVLYFIRDPDDPTFHPVRDVLERNVTTQLRKIAFSALVYGALVIICLGGVVWGLNYSFTGILPIHWSSHTPALEFPLDLLFYNFLTPLVIKVFKPSDGLHLMYQWWFKSCARLLRLSNFLFGEKAKDEEGHYVWRSWSSWFAGEKGDVEKLVIGEDRKSLAEERGTEVYFLFDGKYVRAPASDQVRIPKGDPVFVEVDQFNNRLDGKPEEGGVHARSSDMVTTVYIPPWFRVRIALFVLTIWVFAAATGVGVTIVPLLFGRFIFSYFVPQNVRMNDIYAFSLGIYTLGGAFYACLHMGILITHIRRPLPSPLTTLRTVASTVTKFTCRVLKIAYVYTSLILLLPILFALLLELYILIPLHAYLGPHEPHVVHLIQDWTLGFLYARLAARLIFSNRNSRPARAFAAVIRDGYANPNARLATRCFILPVLVIFGIAVLVPSVLAWALNRTVWAGASEGIKSQVWRFSYPAVAACVGWVWIVREAIGVVGKWRMVVRDEVYLIGERLHNFGEKRPGTMPQRVSENVRT